MDAISTVGSTIIFTVGMNDARKLCQSLQERVTDSDIVSLPKHEAIARIDTEIVRIKTVREVPAGPSCRQEIIERSRSQYYRPAREVLREINHPNRLSDRAFGPLPSGVSGVNGKPPELEYEEL